MSTGEVSLQVRDLAPGITQTSQAGQLGYDAPFRARGHRGCPDTAVDSDDRTHRRVVGLSRRAGRSVVTDGGVPMPVRVPGNGHVQQPGVPAPEQPTQRRLGGTWRGDAEPAVLRQPHPPCLKVQTVSHGEPGSVGTPRLEPREPSPADQKGLMCFGGGPDAVAERPCRVLTGPRRRCRLGRGPEFRQVEVGHRAHSAGLRNVIGGFGVPLVGVRFDLRDRPVVREPARARGTPQDTGLDVCDIQPDPHRGLTMTGIVPPTPDTTSHLHRRGWAGQLSSRRSGSVSGSVSGPSGAVVVSSGLAASSSSAE